MWPAPNAWNGRSKPFARNSTNAWQNCANKARSWKRSASTCAPPTIWKCSPKLACAQASKTIRATLTAAPLAPRRTRCSTSSLTTSCWSSTNHTSLCRRSVPCTRAMPPASARWSNTASACPPRWTTDHSNGRNSCSASARPCTCPPRQATMRWDCPMGWSNRLSAQPVCWTRRSTYARSRGRSTICSPRSRPVWPRTSARWSPL